MMANQESLISYAEILQAPCAYLKFRSMIEEKVNSYNRKKRKRKKKGKFYFEGQ
jgi:hypothetical protein